MSLSNVASKNEAWGTQEAIHTGSIEATTEMLLVLPPKTANMVSHTLGGRRVSKIMYKFWHIARETATFSFAATYAMKGVKSQTPGLGHFQNGQLLPLPPLHEFIHFRPFSHQFEKCKNDITHPAILSPGLLLPTPRFQVAPWLSTDPAAL